MIEPENLLARLGIAYQARGRKLVAPCPNPNHPDKHPSWAAWPDDLGRFRHRCLSCGFGGGPAALVMAVLQCDRRAAHDFLDSTETAGPPPPPGIRVEVRERTSSPVVEVPDEVWVEPFDTWPTPARRYLEKRRLTERERARWGLGYAVDGKLCGRVWIPVRGRTGELVSWTARAFDGDDQKYDSSKVAARSALLGEHLWDEGSAFGRQFTCVVVEGPFDAIAVDASCDVCVAALRGSATGAQTIDPGQAAKLARFPTVIVATDPDDAGNHAADLLRGLGRWTKLYRPTLDGRDCAQVFEDDGAVALATLLGVPMRMEDRSSIALHRQG